MTRRHQFRHIHSSRLNDLKVPVKIAQEQLGQASISTRHHDLPQLGRVDRHRLGPRIHGPGSFRRSASTKSGSN